eukprot:INCI5126.10.p2 GENE.INCI5126.10~~INCI5126.10.p2  ORF type:complete len:306 (-),score=78.58 INCI5126.10:2736-3653(-)
MSRSSEKNDGSGEGQPSAEAAEEAVEVELFSLKKHLIPINKKMTLSQLYEECASGVEDVSPADIRLFLDEAAQEAEQIRPLDTAPADLKKRLGSLATPVKPGTALKAWWASSIMNLEEQEFLSEKIKNVFKKPLGPCLYRGSQHGWTRADFEQHCAMKGPLVVVVQAAGGLAATSAAAGGHIQKRKFGAFLSTNLEKDLEKGRYAATPYSFLFNLSTRKVFNLKPEKTDKGIFFAGTDASTMLSMGGGDLCLYEDCNDHEFSFCRPPLAFEANVKDMLGQEYMYFGVEELEVFTLLSAFAVKKRI